MPNHPLIILFLDLYVARKDSRLGALNSEECMALILKWSLLNIARKKKYL